MKCGVVQFPGSNCDQDIFYVLKDIMGMETHYLWHKDTDLQGADLIVLPGGFSYGDYLRSGAIARISPIMQSVKEHAANGGKVLGICNGFQILTESGLLPGALLRNEGQKFICDSPYVKVVSQKSDFTKNIEIGTVLRLPIAHAEGRYFADDATMASLNANGQIIMRYCSKDGDEAKEFNPNGSLDNIAGISNEAGNVIGLMPHPERVCEAVLGGTDGRVLFENLLGLA